MKTVYRCEDKTKEGPYHRFDENEAPPFLLAHSYDKANHPTPFTDIYDLPNVPKGWYCGFSSMEQMEKWFTKEDRQKLREMGFLFYEMLVAEDKFRDGRHQCLFKREEAIAVKEIEV